MGRPRISLRHTLFGALFAGCLLFGGAQAFAAPPGYEPIPVACDSRDPASEQLCKDACAKEGYVDGQCYNALGTCICQVW